MAGRARAIVRKAGRVAATGLAIVGLEAATVDCAAIKHREPTRIEIGTHIGKPVAKMTTQEKRAFLNKKTAELQNALKEFKASKKTAKQFRLVVDHSDKMMYIYKGGQLVAYVPVAIGKNSGKKTREGDKKTPIGNYWISRAVDPATVRLMNQEYKRKHGVPNAYGTSVAFRLSYPTKYDRNEGLTGGGIYIHGGSAESMGHGVSSGCVRVYQTHLDLLSEIMWESMPVELVE